uniref:LOW QUALITY PROTEIN: uncharacterized protein LOC108053746 n=1 Tax=Drosophila rhopaloa TaxID=1041015 RepID=A0A6P4G337_DRORH
QANPDLALQLRLLGGSNGSSATECVSALYARTLEQQREEFQRTVEQRTLHQLDRELHTFLLNQLLLGVQFFGHFEAEMGVVDAQLLARRRNCSAENLAEHSLIQSSAIDAAVARNLLFQPASSKSPPQPLQKPLTYVVFENVDVARPHDANYDTVAALCKVLPRRSEEEEEEHEHEHRGDHKYPPAGYETVQVLRQCQVEQLQQCYLSSQQFMLYFGELLRQHLADQLGISQSQLAAGSYRGCSVYTAREELVPAIHVPNSWPDCAFEFWLRARPRLTNIHTAEQFQWPTEQMKKRIRSFGFHVVPVGYAPKHSRNPFRELEWRIVFPQAEQFLERHCLTPMQLKVFQLMKLLVKTFVEDTSSAGQSPEALLEQLRAHLFWQCEGHSNDWPEEFLGERLVRFIRSFDACLARKHLSDYFIERRNLFEHVPEDTLMKLRTIMAGIAEQPLLHVVQALRNLRHAPDFYPQLDHKRLLDNLFSQDYLELHAWGKFSRPRQGFPAQENREDDQEQQLESRKEDITDARGLLGLAQHQERSRGKLRRKTQLLKATNQQLQLSVAEQRRSSLDFLDLQLLLTRPNPEAASQDTAKPQLNNGLEILRRSNLLELLLDHLLAMLAHSTRLGNRGHAQLYLEQGQRLCRLYQHLGCSQQAQHFIQELQEAASRIEVMSRTPLPNRAGGSPPLEDESPPVRRKSIKFQEHVVQIHSPDPLARQNHMSHLKTHKLNGILRGNHYEEQIETPQEEDNKSTLQEIQIGMEEHTKRVETMEAPKEDDIENQTKDESESERTPKGETLLSLNGILQRLNLDTDKMQMLSSKTEQLVQKVAPSEAKRDELKDILKRKTQKLKGALN